LEEVPDFYWGASLDKFIEESHVEREPLIERFLYKRSTQMIYAPDGQGKSLMALQMCIQGTVPDGKVFGEFSVGQGFNSIYFQNERPLDEAAERLKAMRQATPFVSTMMVLTKILQGTNLRNAQSFERAIAKVDHVVTSTVRIPDLIVLDGLYAIVRGGMKDDEGASYITEFVRYLQAKYDCTILMVHHANRGQRDKESGERMNEDMYGSRFLSAHCTGVYKMNLKPDKSGSVLTCEKTSHSNLEPRIELTYDPESELSFVVDGSTMTDKQAKVWAYIEGCKATKRHFTIKELTTKTGVCKRSIRQFFLAHLKNRVQIVSKSKYGTNIYEAI
jgi:RecA-family ATPase